MFAFGHVGLTWGGALLLARLSRRLPPWGRRARAAVSRAETRAERPSVAAIDYRLVILGSILPDLIDKPLGVFILREELSNGRIFAHSLLFVVLLLLAALAWRRSAGPALSLLALGSAAHLALDRLWMDPDTLLWPLLRWRLERQDVSDWPEQMLEQLSTDPYVYVSEVVGAAVVAALLASLLVRRGLRGFALSGRMGRRLEGLPGFGLAAWEESPQQLKRGERPAERQAEQRPERRQAARQAQDHPRGIVDVTVVGNERLEPLVPEGGYQVVDIAVAECEAEAADAQAPDQLAPDL